MTWELSHLQHCSFCTRVGTEWISHLFSRQNVWVSRMLFQYIQKHQLKPKSTYLFCLCEEQWFCYTTVIPEQSQADGKRSITIVTDKITDQLIKNIIGKCIYYPWCCDEVFHDLRKKINSARQYSCSLFTTSIWQQKQICKTSENLFTRPESRWFECRRVAAVVWPSERVHICLSISLLVSFDTIRALLFYIFVSLHCLCFFFLFKTDKSQAGHFHQLFQILLAMEHSWADR